jgi:hypothetical protein
MKIFSPNKIPSRRVTRRRASFDQPRDLGFEESAFG